MAWGGCCLNIPFMTQSLPPIPPSGVPVNSFPQPRTAEELWHLLQNPQSTAHGARHLGEALVLAGALSEDVLQAALAAQLEERTRGMQRPLGRLLVERGLVDESRLQYVIADWLGNCVVDARQFQFDRQALERVPRHVAEAEAVLPLLLQDDLIVLLMADPLDQRLIDELRFMTQRRVVPVLAAPGSLMPALARAYDHLRDVHPSAPPPSGAAAKKAATGAQGTKSPAGAGAGPGGRGAPRAAARELARDLQTAQDDNTSDAQETDIVSESDNTLVRLINSLIEEAIAQKASDIHIETEAAPKKVRIRFRLDGELVRYLEVESRYRYALVARIKIMAGMDISEHRKPQDGKIDFSRFGGTKTELRVVTVPTTGGLEDVVLRLLAGSKPMPMDSIGLSLDNLRDLRRMALKPYGLILVCGPTGSGKTTTLHSLISDINTDSRKIWTAEDPIEITQEGLRQVQMNPRIGWTFAAAMRTFLRADPDVIMIGEMRDEETARIAVEASLTGHLVLSTLHTNSAPESITRLLEIGLDPFNFSDSLLAILAQRLVRRLCKKCVTSRPATPDELRALASHYLDSLPSHTSADTDALLARWLAEHGVEDTPGQGRYLRTFVKQGCDVCEGRGYKGRLGIYELMLNDDAIRHHIRARSSAGEIRNSALGAGMKTLRQDGMDKVMAGLTDVAEVIAATNL
jgi:type II secretory ATPase GspE/PulE/Tfp pilus assembly ATPase PilB-like protein